MPVTLPEFRVGQSQDYLALSVFPLFTATASPVEYVLSDEALSGGMVEVKEVSEGGSVPDLLVENKGTSRVLFLEGEELVGAKQNRVLNTTVLIGAGKDLVHIGTLLKRTEDLLKFKGVRRSSRL